VSQPGRKSVAVVRLKYLKWSSYSTLPVYRSLTCSLNAQTTLKPVRALHRDHRLSASRHRQYSCRASCPPVSAYHVDEPVRKIGAGRRNSPISSMLDHRLSCRSFRRVSEDYILLLWRKRSQQMLCHSTSFSAVLAGASISDLQLPKTYVSLEDLRPRTPQVALSRSDVQYSLLQPLLASQLCRRVRTDRYSLETF